MNGAGEVPRRWPWLVRHAARSMRRTIARHFHAVRLSRGSAPLPDGDAPVLVVLNHPSWWDPLTCVVALDQFPGREHFAAIAAHGLAKYRVLGKLGFFGVDTESHRGAAAFLRTGTAILARPNHALWLTAQGRFADARARPLGLRPGVGHLAARMSRGWVVPLALEYTFWTERTPEALLRFGPPIDVADDPVRSAKEWTARIETALTATLDSLNADAITRDPARFTTLVGGAAGVGGVYDFCRRLTARLRGERFDPSHGGEPT